MKRRQSAGQSGGGGATLFIFADLNAGNTTYKAVQRGVNVIKIGPMLQGLRRPVNDLLRRPLPKSFWSKWEPQAIKICLSAA
jgi:phosphotransacetylase